MSPMRRYGPFLLPNGILSRLLPWSEYRVAWYVMEFAGLSYIELVRRERVPSMSVQSTYSVMIRSVCPFTFISSSMSVI